MKHTDKFQATMIILKVPNFKNSDQTQEAHFKCYLTIVQYKILVAPKSLKTKKNQLVNLDVPKNVRTGA